MTIKLILLPTDHQGLAYELTPERQWLIGRNREEVDIYLEDPTVSRRHATIYFDSTWRLKDHSTHGTKIMLWRWEDLEKRVMRVESRLVNNDTFVLENNCRVRMGNLFDYFVLFHDLDSAATIPSPSADTLAQPQTPMHSGSVLTVSLTGEVLVNGTRTDLSPRERLLVRYLYARCNHVCSIEDVFLFMFAENNESPRIVSDNVHELVGRVRRELGARGKYHIQSHQGGGYILYPRLS